MRIQPDAAEPSEPENKKNPPIAPQNPEPEPESRIQNPLLHRRNLHLLTRQRHVPPAAAADQSVSVNGGRGHVGVACGMGGRGHLSADIFSSLTLEAEQISLNHCEVGKEGMVCE